MKEKSKNYLQAPSNISLEEILKLSEKLTEYEDGELIIDGDHLHESLSEKIKAFTNLIMRSDPGDKKGLFSNIPKDSVLNLFSEKEKGWYLVEYQGTIGYVSKKHTKKTI